MTNVEDKVLETNASILYTPLVDIFIADEEGNSLLFDIIESTNTVHTVYINNDENNIQEVRDYGEKMIRIDTRVLPIGKKYYICSSKPIESRDSDEHLFTYGYTEGTQTFAISFPDPNDDLKCFPELYKETNKMMWYDFNGEVPKGRKAVSFYLIDREKPYIYVSAAWIMNITDHMDNYESAAEVFTWII